MFQNKGQRYVTKGVMDSLPVELQALCWKSKVGSSSRRTRSKKRVSDFT